VPGENIDAEVLVYYITKYVDDTAKITSSRHPTVSLVNCSVRIVLTVRRINLGLALMSQPRRH
jgi:hypothetical protein